jgi:hypothetical protein
MKTALIAAMALCVTATTAHAFTNEAVKTLSGGRQEVELPPGPKHKRPPRPDENPWRTDYLRPAYVIQTSTGLQECPRTWVDAGCRPYLKGRDTRSRGWVVKSGGRWLTCPRRDTTAGCRDYYELPATSVQD